LRRLDRPPHHPRTIIAGRIFDLTHSYSGALVLFSAMALIASLAIRATLPLAEERARQVPAGEPATACD
jgi:hypothetical protein